MEEFPVTNTRPYDKSLLSSLTSLFGGVCASTSATFVGSFTIEATNKD